jgi:hypothetical protein
MHPLQPDLTVLSDQELENKTNELNRKYFQALRYSPTAAGQISMMLEGFRWEAQRRAMDRAKQKNNDDPGLDDLIKID